MPSSPTPQPTPTPITAPLHPKQSTVVTKNSFVITELRVLRWNCQSQSITLAMTLEIHQIMLLVGEPFWKKKKTPQQNNKIKPHKAQENYNFDVVQFFTLYGGIQLTSTK